MSKRKAYRSRAKRIPAIVDMHSARQAHPELALKLRMGVIGLITSPSVPACNFLSLQLTRIVGGMSLMRGGEAIIGATDPAAISIKSAILAVEAIVTRHDRTGVVAVDRYEQMALEGAVSRLDEVLGKIPASCYARACVEISEFLGVAA
jgi:hypothetical protein